MKRACVIGWPIEQSRSPLIHGYWLQQYGIDGEYTKLAVPPQDLDAFLRTLAQEGLAGCNVTVPHKQAAFAAAEIRDPSAQAVGAANTLWLEDGRLHAANTDTYGFMTHLSASAPDWAAQGGPICILGAGGAARAIVHGFMESGAREIHLFNRSRERAGELAQHFGSRVRVYDWSQRQAGSAKASVLVNTTTLGMKGAGSLDMDFAGLPAACVAADIIYVPLETEFLAGARTAGLKTVDGLGMLLHQAVPGFEKWFGIRPEVTQELRDLIVRDIEDRKC